MSDTDSLYRLSISPPPRGHSQSKHMDSKSKDRTYPVTLGGQSSKRPKGAGDLRNYVQTSKPFAFNAPTAKMTATPPENQLSILQTPTSIHSDKGKSRAAEPSPPILRSKMTRAKKAVDYQAEADAIEEARDLADPDFNVTQESDEVKIPRKRHREGQTTRSPPATRTRQKRQRNRLYANCGDDTRDTRDKHVARIQENWGVPPDQWMPQSIMPSALKKVKGKRAVRRPLPDPRDWNGSLLAELAYLSNSTKGKCDEAYKALKNAVSEKNRGGGGPELLPRDVQRVIRRLGSTTAESTNPNVTPPSAPVTEGDCIRVERISNEAITAMNQEELPPQLPSPRSPTFADDVVIKEDPCPVPPVHPSSSDPGGWEGYDAELEKFEEADLQWKENQARLAVASAELARFQQKKRLRQLARQHGRNRQDAILITSEDGEE